MLTLVALAHATPPVPAPPPTAPTLCASGEQTVLACADRGKVYSLCASPDFGRGTGWLEYRFGKPGAIELVYPSSRQDSHRAFHYSLTAIHGRADGWLRFDNGGYTYEIQYQADYRADPPTSSLALTVSRQGEALARFGCSPLIDRFEELSSAF